MNEKQAIHRIAATILALFASLYDAAAVTNFVTTTSDTGAGSLRAAISNANATAALDFIYFNIPGTGPFTITPVTALPTITNSVVMDGYTQPGASPNTLANGDNAVIEIVVAGGFGSLTLDTSNSTIQGLAFRSITLPAAPAPKGSNVIQGDFVGLDATGTNSLGDTGAGIMVNSPNNQIGGTTPAARNVVSGHGATGIEMAGAFATETLIQGNFVGTDRTGTQSIGNHDRAVIMNSFTSSNTVGGTTTSARNVIAGNLDRGMVLDGTNNVAMGNYIGVDVNGNPLGNARSGVEIAGSSNVCGGTAAGAGNIIWNNGVNGGGAFTTNGVDTQAAAVGFSILGNSIYNNAGLGIDVKEDGLITPGFPVLTVASNTPAGTVVSGKAPTNGTFRLELFSNPVCDPSGNGEGKTLISSTLVTPLVNSNFTITVSSAVSPGSFITATANGASEFSACQQVVLSGSTNSWTNSVSGAWENGTNWSLGGAPYIALSAALITNANTKTVTINSNTAANFPSTMSISNLTVGAPGGAINTLSVNNAGTNTPLHIYSSLIISNGGAMTFTNSSLLVDGSTNFSQLIIDGPVTLSGGTLLATNPSINIGYLATGSLALSNATATLAGPILGNSSLGASGNLTIKSGTLIVPGSMYLAYNPNTTGTVWLTDSRLEITNFVTVLDIALFGVGQFTASNSTVECNSLTVGQVAGALGTYTTVGTTNRLGNLFIGSQTAGTGSVVVIGGLVVATNNTSKIGNSGIGQLSLSNATAIFSYPQIGLSAGSKGTLTAAGATISVTTVMDLADSATATGTVWLTNSRLAVTNTIYVGLFGTAQFTDSNSTCSAGEVDVASQPGAHGTYTMVGSTNSFNTILIAENLGATGAVQIAGGQLTVSNLTVGSQGFGQMTVSNGNVAVTSQANIGNGIGSRGSLVLAGGTTTISNYVFIGNTGTGQVTVTGGTLQCDRVLAGELGQGVGTFTVAGGINNLSLDLDLGNDASTARGYAWITGGQLTVNRYAQIGDSGPGQMTISNGTVEVDIVADVGIFNNGTLTVAGGTCTMLGPLYLAAGAASTGKVWVTGGLLTVTNPPTILSVGELGAGQMTISNGIVLAKDLEVARVPGSIGTLTMAGGALIADRLLATNTASIIEFPAGVMTLSGAQIANSQDFIVGAPGRTAVLNLVAGTNNFVSEIHLGSLAGSTGMLWMTGGLLIEGDNFYVADNGVAQMTVSNGTCRSAYPLTVASNPGGRGTLTVAGGDVHDYSAIVIGLASCASTGTVVVTGGQLFVTNAAHNATLEVVSGTLIQSGGTLEIDRLILTNACGHFVRTGGALITGSVTLDPNLSAVGDGIPNSWKQQYGFDPFDPTVASADPDGDGISNLDEFLTGTDPTNGHSFFHIVSVARETNNVRVTWTTVGGHTNRVLVSTGTADGSYTDNFANLSSFFIIPGTSEGTTNFLDLGGATNRPARYYGVRLVP